MKYALMFILAFLFNSLAHADCTESTSANKVEEQQEIQTDVPNFLKGATITVRLANGKESTVPAEKFKVVPRLQQYLVTKVSKETVKSCSSTVTEYKIRKDRISLGIGDGPTGKLGLSGNSNYQEIDAQRGAVGAGQWQHMLNDRWSLGVQGQTNKTGLIFGGYDF